MVATDPDGDALTYSAVGLPAGLTLNAATGLIAGSLSCRQPPAAHQVTATASDGALSSSQTFTWTCRQATNRAPILANPGNRRAETRASRQRPCRPMRRSPTGASREGTRARARPASAGRIQEPCPAASRFGQPGALGDGNPAMLFNGSTGYVGSPTARRYNWRGTSPLSCGQRVAGDAADADLQGLPPRVRADAGNRRPARNLYQGTARRTGACCRGRAPSPPNTWQHVVVTRAARRTRFGSTSTASLRAAAPTRVAQRCRPQGGANRTEQAGVRLPICDGPARRGRPLLERR